MNKVRRFSSPIHSVLWSVVNGLENGFKKLSSEFKGVKSSVHHLRDDIYEREERFLQQAAINEDMRAKSREINETMAKIVEKMDKLEELTAGIHSGLNGSAPIDVAPEPEAQAGGEQISVLDVASSVVTAPPVFSETDPRFDLNENTTIPALLDEWYISTPARYSVAHRNKVYKANWRRKNSKVAPIYRRKKATINFLQRLSAEIEDGRLSMRQLGFLAEKYRLSKSCTLPNLIRFQLEQKAGCKRAITPVVDMWEKLSPAERQEVYDVKG